MKISLSSCDPVQAAAITENSGRNILVSASAGAGKTRVLVTRILKRCAEDRIPLPEILAITFTEAAAEEMKNRVSEGLFDLLHSCSEPEDKDWLRRQIAALPAANITTIDAFCLNLIRTYGSLIGLNPACGYNILTSGENRRIFQRAYEEVLIDAIHQSHDELMDLMTALSPRSEDFDTLFDILHGIIVQAQTDACPGEWYRKAAGVYPDCSDLSAIPENCCTYFLQMLQQKTGACLEILIRMQKSAEEREPAFRETYASMSILCQNCLATLEEGLRGYADFRNFLHTLAVFRQKKPKDPQLADLRDQLHKQIDDLLSVCYPPEVFAAGTHRSAVRVRMLLKLAQAVQERAQQIKREEAVLDFADMERYALDILSCEDLSTIRQIQSSYQEILVDEFQDTSLLQNTIITRIAGTHPVFRVGDVKQSIYRFRQARPQLFRSMLQDGSQSVFRMKRNYRSDPQIIAFTNTLFSRIMNVPGMKDTYTAEDTAECGRSIPADDEPACHVHLVLIRNSEDDGKSSAAQMRRQKAACIASMIRNTVLEKQRSYRDFAVLCRSHQDQIAIRRAMVQAQIPCAADTREGFYSSDLCLLIHAVLRYMIDRTDQPALLAVLVSELFGMNDETIAEMMLQMRQDPALKECREKDLSLCIRSYQPQIITFFDHLLQTAETKGLPAFLEELACTEAAGGKFVFYEVLNSQNRADFDYLREMVLARSSMTINDLIAEMENGQDDQSSQASVTGKDDDVVQIVTIHGSKGLQYRYVFLWGTGHSAPAGTDARVVCDADLGIAVADVNTEQHTILPTIQSLAFAQKISAEDLEEYTRVLYVAATRAEEQLYIVDNAENIQDCQPITASFLKRRTGITGLITAAIEHNPGFNENGLIETVFLCSEELPEESAPLPDVLKEPLRMLSAKPLTELRTPSSYEQEEEIFLPELEIGTGGAAYGTRMHEAAALLPDQEVWTEAMIREICGEELTADDCRKLMNFDQSELRRSTLQMEIHKEYPFYYEDPQIRMNGTFDYLAIGGHRIILIDYKTDSKNEEQLKQTYAPQINAYRKALQGMYPDYEIRTYLWSFAMSRAIELTETEK